MQKLNKTKLQIQLTKVRTMIIKFERQMENELLKIYNKIKAIENGNMWKL